MTDSGLAAIRPFDQLPEPVLQGLAEILEYADYQPGQRLLAAGQTPEHLYIVQRGAVWEQETGETVAWYFPGDSFDAQALTGGRSQRDYVAMENTGCWLLPREAFLELTRAHPTFAGFYFASLSQKLDDMLARQHNRELSSFMVARINEAYIHPPLTVPATTTIHQAARAMRDNKATSLLVERDGRVGIVTGQDLRDRVILERQSVDGPVGDIACFELIALESDDFLFKALLTMTRHGVSRVVVRKGEALAGVLEQIDLLSFFSNHSRLIAIQIERADSREELRRASRSIVSVIQTLQAQGVKIRHITQLVAELNKQLFAKLFALLAPPELLANACLLVMGSEGREEQILKTDQDNAIVLRDGFQPPDLEALTQEFTDCLLDFGYPRCPGNIMVSNLYWAKSVTDYKREIARWIHSPSEESFMQFAIFFDAMAVAGDEALLESVREMLFDTLRDHPVFYSLFAKATLAFETPLGFFSNFVVDKKDHPDELDIKKGGIFPIVHGVRSLALEQRLRERNTIQRIRGLQRMKLFQDRFAVDLIEAFAYMSSLRLNAGLDKLQRGLPQDNYINPGQLNKLEQDLLRDCFKIVNEFKKFITHHFRLNMLG